MLKNQLERKLTTITTSIFVFSFAFVFTFIFSAQFNPVYDGSAAEISVMNQVTGYYANLSSLGTLNLTLASSPEGTYATTKDTITVDTNTTTGYKLYISTIDHSSDTPSLPSGTPSNGLIDSASGSYLSPSTGAADTPVRLAVNTWGYVPSRTTSSEASVEYTDADADPTSGQAVWRAVPEYGNEDIFYTNTTPETTSTNSVDVYYAVNANTSLPSGTYSNTVLYTAIANEVEDEEDKQVSVYPTYQNGVAAGKLITIATGLYPATLEDIGTIAVTIGGNSCTDITPTLTEAGTLNLTCNTPAQTASGDYTVVVNVAKYGKTYTITNGYTYRGFFDITKMQEMSASVCSTATTPAITATTTDLDGSYTGNTAYVPQTTLTDTRDNNTYVVRKLADGNCWMIQNLNLKLSTSKTLTSADTDLNTKSSWTPSYDTMNTSVFTNDNPGPKEFLTGQSYYFGDNLYTSGTNCQVFTGLPQVYNPTDANGATESVALCRDGDPTDSVGTAYRQTAKAGSSDGSDSICPRGWRLPAASSNGNGSWGGLLATYGIEFATSVGSRAAQSFPIDLNNPGDYWTNGRNPYWSFAGDEATRISFSTMFAGAGFGWFGAAGNALYGVRVSTGYGTDQFTTIHSASASIRCVAR